MFLGFVTGQSHHSFQIFALKFNFTIIFIRRATNNIFCIIYLHFRRLMVIRSCESKCLFSGSRGEVCVIEPLLVHRMKSDHPAKDVILLAMCSLSKVSQCQFGSVNCG